MYKVIILSKLKSLVLPILARLCCLNPIHASFKVWFFGRSPGKPYRWLPLDNRCATKRAELSVIAHGGTKNPVGFGNRTDNLTQWLVQILDCLSIPHK
ncbi:hypothetical protein Hanom_Chr12g01123751 [Helianthus anomalus]